MILEKYTKEELIEIIRHCAGGDEAHCNGCPAEDGPCCNVARHGYSGIPKDLMIHVTNALSDGDSDYRRGLNDGFTLAEAYARLLRDYTVEEVIRKIKEYYDDFHIGDEVVFGEQSKHNGVITRIVNYGARTLRVLCKDGCVRLVYPGSASVKKTGRHLNEVEELLKLIEDGEDEDG